MTSAAPERQGAVGEVVIHAARALRQSVTGAQARPAVGAVQHLVGEHDAQLRVGRAGRRCGGCRARRRAASGMASA